MQVRNKIGDIHSVIDRAVAAHIGALGTTKPTDGQRRNSLVPARRMSRMAGPPRKVQEEPVLTVWQPESIEVTPVQTEAVELFGLKESEQIETGSESQVTNAVLWSSGEPVVTLGFGYW
jgi:hypothetical protein